MIYGVVLAIVVAWPIVGLLFAIGAEVDYDDAFWWPIHVTKALLKSLYRALFHGWSA